MTDFLLELRSEEIPARMQDKARADLARLFAGEIAKAGLKAADLTTYATPRRLALMAHGLPLMTEAVREELKGPRTSAPPQALEGFLRKAGLTQDQLEDRDGVWFAVIEKAGRETADVLAEAIPAIVRAFPWPKSMRWGVSSVSTESLRWVRPLQGVVALLGDDVVPFEIDGVTSGAATLGHRFHHAGPVTIGNAGDYAAKLRACHVIVDQAERQAIIREGAAKAAADAGLVLVEDEGLVAENAGLTEWPVPMLGRFDPAFLEVPEEVIQLTARVNQKYFVCRKSSPSLFGEGDRSPKASGGGESSPPSAADAAATPPSKLGGDLKLANAFVLTANLTPNDGGAAVISGNEKVLAARLSDARFFWEQDLKVPLESHAEKLKDIVFHEKLGTVADKVERVAKLARWLVEEGVIKGANADDAEHAARLAKADLVTGMVGEFPELQGVMGGYYARAQGESDAVADAVRDHYKPVGQGDEVPTVPVTVAVSLADKLDTLIGFFAFREQPTGSRDPFALRRAALGIAALLNENRMRLSLDATTLQVADHLSDQFNERWQDWESATIADLELYDKNWRMVDGVLHYADRVIGPLRNVGTQNAIMQETQTRLYEARDEVSSFLADRLKVQQREAGVRHDLIDAVFALGGEDDLVRLLARVKALQSFVETDEGANLLAGYKRAANILKQAEDRDTNRHPELVSGSMKAAQSHGEAAWMLKQVQHDEMEAEAAGAPAQAGAQEGAGLLLPHEHEEAEAVLFGALDTAEPKAAAAIEAEDFEGAMAALATLRAPIDAFFDGVMVNDPDEKKRAFRLGMLARFRDAVHRVADFSKIEG